jgi:hypothetical protein
VRLSARKIGLLLNLDQFSYVLNTKMDSKERQIYLGENLSQTQFFKKLRSLEKQENALNASLRMAGKNPDVEINPYKIRRQAMLLNLL